MSDHTPDQNPFADLAAAWADQTDTSAAEVLAGDPDSITASIAEAHRRDQRRLAWLNVRESAAGLFVAVVFGLSAASAMVPWAVLAAAALVVAVIGFFAASSIRHQLADRQWDGSMRSQIDRRLDQVRHRARLYRTVVWWYLTPIAVAIVLYRYGVAGDLRLGTGDLIYYAICVVMFVGLYLMNRRVGRLEYEPEIERLETLLADLERID